MLYVRIYGNDSTKYTCHSVLVSSSFNKTESVKWRPDQTKLYCNMTDLLAQSVLSYQLGEVDLRLILSSGLSSVGSGSEIASSGMAVWYEYMSVHVHEFACASGGGGGGGGGGGEWDMWIWEWNGKIIRPHAQYTSNRNGICYRH